MIGRDLAPEQMCHHSHSTANGKLATPSDRGGKKTRVDFAAYIVFNKRHINQDNVFKLMGPHKT